MFKYKGEVPREMDLDGGKVVRGRFIKRAAGRDVGSEESDMSD